MQLKVKKGKDAKSPKKKTTAKQPRRTKAAPASAQASDGHPAERICEYIRFSCTCHGRLGIKNKYGYQCTRKRKHAIAQGLRSGMFVVPKEMELGVVSKPKSAGRLKKAGKCLDPESDSSGTDDDESSDDEVDEVDEDLIVDDDIE